MNRNLQRAVVAAVSAEPGVWTPGDLAADLGVSRPTMRRALAAVPVHRQRGSGWRLYPGWCVPELGDATLLEMAERDEARRLAALMREWA